MFFSCWQNIICLKWQQTVVYVFLKVKYFDSHLRLIDFILLPNGILKSAQNTMVQNPVTHMIKIFSCKPTLQMGLARKEEELERREGKWISVGSRFENNPDFYYLCMFLCRHHFCAINNRSRTAKLVWICLNVH